jgi:carboxypeptidase C (cathepsin A)
VPHTGAEAWTAGLGLPAEEGWRPWYAADQQVAGYTVRYKGLTFATILGAGHFTPDTNPTQSLAMFSRFMQGGRL